LTRALYEKSFLAGFAGSSSCPLRHMKIKQALICLFNPVEKRPIPNGTFFEP
jgi:hypothetical protein